MASAIKSIVADVEAAVASGDAERRRTMLRDMANLFAGDAARLSVDQVAAFDVVIMRLARDMETEARAELSERLADFPNAPGTVVRNLAFDPSAEVAGPILERSTRLSEDDLVHVAEQRGQGHLLAVTRRSVLSKRVTDILVHRGDNDVLRSVAGNHGAEFSERGHTTLVNRAVADPVLRSALEKRDDLPPAYRKRLVAVAQEHAARALNEQFGPAAQEAIAHAVNAAASTRRAPVRDDELLAAEVAVSTMARKEALNEFAVTQCLMEGRATEALVALARLASVPSKVALQAFEAESDEPLLILVRAAKCGWRTLKQLMAAKSAQAPSPAAMQGAMEAFQALSVATAQRVIRFAATQDAAAGAR